MTFAADIHGLSNMSRGGMTGIGNGRAGNSTVVSHMEEVTMRCIDLRERFGDQYRIACEEPANSRWTDPW